LAASTQVSIVDTLDGLSDCTYVKIPARFFFAEDEQVNGFILIEFGSFLLQIFNRFAVWLNNRHIVDLIACVLNNYPYGTGKEGELCRSS
jgi:hypothetical protein